MQSRTFEGVDFSDPGHIQRGVMGHICVRYERLDTPRVKLLYTPEFMGQAPSR